MASAPASASSLISSVNSMGCVIARRCWRKSINFIKSYQQQQYPLVVNANSENDDDASESFHVEYPTVIKIPIRLTLTSVVYKRPNENYTVFVFASRDTQDHPSLNKVVDIKALGKEHKFDFCMKNYPKLPDFLHVWLFVTYQDESNLECQTLLATGFISVAQLFNARSGVSMDLFDVETKRQASAHVLCGKVHLDGVQTYLPAIKKLEHLGVGKIHPLAQTYMDRVNKIYEEVVHTHDQKFVYVDTHIGRLPLIAYPILATTIQGKSEEMARLLKHFLQVAAIMTDVNLPCFDTFSIEMKMELVGEMLTLIPRSLIYQQDFVRTGSTTNKMVDHWTVLSTFPNLGVASFDCEDAAKNMLELFTVFKYCKIPYKSEHDRHDYRELKQLQQLLQKYTAFLCLGILNLGQGKSTPHAYVVLLDVEYVNLLMNGKPDDLNEKKKNQLFLPALALEGTNYTGSVWSRGEMKVSVDDKTQYDSLTRTLSELKNNEKWSKILKYKMPQYEVEAQSMYGPVTALITGDHSEFPGVSVSVHALLGESGQNNSFAIGTSVQKLLYYDWVDLKIALKLEFSEITEIKQSLLCEFPPSILPTAPPSMSQRLRSIVKPKILMRSVDCKHNLSGVLTHKKFNQSEIPLCHSHDRKITLISLF